MADDPTTRIPTEEVPTASAAYLDADIRDSPEATVVRAGTLLTIVSPRRRAMIDDELAEHEAREILGIPSVGQVTVGREAIVSILASLGRLGRSAARIASEERVPGERSDGRRYAAALRTRADVQPQELEIITSNERVAAATIFDRIDRGVFPAGSVGPATELVVGSMLDPDPLVRVAAASATLRLDEANPLALAILDDASDNEGTEVALLARAGLAAGRGYESRRGEIVGGDGRDRRLPGQPDSALIHGTWSRRGRWWRPDGDFHRFLKDDGIFPNLHSGDDSFRWSGYYSFRMWRPVSLFDWNRTQAGGSLAWWAESRLKSPPDLIGHSYGASVAMLATALQKSVRALVLLSPAVHRACLPDPACYEAALVVRMRLDLVLLADRSKSALLRALPNVTEKLVPRTGWLGHAGTRDPAVWRSNGIDELVRDEWLPKLSDRT